MRNVLMLFLSVLLSVQLWGAVGDPQIMTDHPYYPGELACSTFERLFKTEAALYKRATGKEPASDEEKALAAWYWRNLHYAHGTEGKEDYFGKGFLNEWNREYWTGLFSHGFGLCGTTHSQWCAEMDRLLGPSRGRVVGVAGHNSFEVYLTGGAYGEGKWCLLDHDISTVIYNPDGGRLLSIQEIKADLATLKNPNFKPERQHGWRVAGLHDDDAGAYAEYKTAEYHSGYAGPPPAVQLRAGETLRRYLKPGLEDGKTFVYWGQNYKAGGVPGLWRDRTWVNQPEKMYQAKSNCGQTGNARFGNAVFTYQPDIAGGSYKEGVVEEAADHITFEFQSPYVIAATPPNDKPWGVYDAGGKNGLVLSGKLSCPVAVSLDRGKTWKDAGSASDGMDLTDLVKGYRQYWLKLGAAPKDLTAAGLSIRTVCQANPAVMPRVHDGTNKATFLASGRALVSAGPTVAQAEAHVVDGKLGSPTVTLELTPPRGEKAVRVYAASHQSSGNPPRGIVFHVHCSSDAGKTWKELTKDWKIIRRPPEPEDFWSQSMTWCEGELDPMAGPVRVRFTNEGGKNFTRAEAHLAYTVSHPGALDVTFAWKEGGAFKTASHAFPSAPGTEDASWNFPAGPNPETVWVEFKAK